MNRHDGERIDRLGKMIKSKRERQPNGQKKRLAHKVTFQDQVPVDGKSKGLEDVIFVESYKKYNLDTTYNDHGCCTIIWSSYLDRVSSWDSGEHIGTRGGEMLITLWHRVDTFKAFQSKNEVSRNGRESRSKACMPGVSYYNFINQSSQLDTSQALQIRSYHLPQPLLLGLSRFIFAGLGRESGPTGSNLGTSWPENYAVGCSAYIHL